MIVKNIYESKSDFVKFSPSEKIVYEMVKKLYQKETETTERIKENSLPQTTLFNCVHTITSKLKEEEYPEAFIDEIWDEIKHIRGKRNDPIKNRPAGDFWGDDYDFHVNRWYEATVIFACVYVIMAIDCPEKVDCLETIKEKCAYNENSTPYFEYFEKSLQDWKKNQERFFESSEIQKDLKENSTNHYSENEWIANEKHVSWEFDNFRKTLVGKSTDEKFRDCLEEYQREQNMPHPNSLYLKLLDREIQYYQRHIAETNSPTIQVNDIISVLQENKFSPAKAVQILEIINYILYARQYPEDICGNIDKKINLFKQNIQPDEEETETQKNAQKRTLKVTTDVMIALLKEAGYVANNDNTKIARLISYLTGFSEEKIRQRFSEPNELTSYHKEEVENVNKILVDINSEISIKYNKQR